MRRLIERELRKWKQKKIRKPLEVGKSARAREYENDLEWLVAGNYVEKIIRVNRMEIPLRRFQKNDFFKLFMPDVGLLRKKANYPPSILIRLEVQICLKALYLKMDGKILNIPFPLISELFRLIELAKQK